MVAMSDRSLAESWSSDAPAWLPSGEGAEQAPSAARAIDTWARARGSARAMGAGLMDHGGSVDNPVCSKLDKFRRVVEESDP
jgi:hypothetical protein